MAAEVEAITGSLSEFSLEAARAQEEVERMRDEFGKLTKEGQKFANGFERDLSGALRAVIIRGENLSDVMRNLALSIADKSLDAAISPLLSMASTAFSGFMPFANGGVVSQGRVQAFAKGGVVGAPMMFPMKGGAGLMGEAGAEAIMPLKRGADGRLGVAAERSNHVQVNMHVSTPDVSGFYKSRSQISSQLERAISRTRR